MPRVTIVPRQQQPTATSSSSSTTSTNTSSTSPSTSSSPTSSLSSGSITSTVTGSPSSSSPASTSTVNTSAFFPDPSQRVQPSKDSSELPKRVLEWIFLSLAIILIFGSIVRRCGLLTYFLFLSKDVKTMITHFLPSFPPSLPFLSSPSAHQTNKSLNQLHIQQRPLSEFFSCFRRRSRRHPHRGHACCHHHHSRSNNRLFCHSRQSSQSTSSSSSSRVTEHVNVVRGRYDLRVPPSAYVGIGVGALRTTTSARRYPPVALDLANVPLSAELNALGRGAGEGTGAGTGGGARLGLGFLGGRAAATRGVTRAGNVDEGGRRLDSGRGFDGEEVEGEDGDGGLGGGLGGREKPEELPAYDKY
ncbi:hypothetical protein K435DRAFT_399616 [Dendrothele bispora CBS 962.96]|uniref:Uncharacterized protein n=1 Tax=Dendrothele bispora (strain CBS 962.96) TaxID=1314807 RepID=A0A4S8L8X1_DENBC|nr:hypothetical protein K435DRAFT_399616 [Dendrothele bispora CBS 962.96]